MAGVFQGLSDYLFGVDPIDDSSRRQMEDYLARQARDYAQREQADYLHQSDYGRMLLDQIKGVGVPSVAERQLGAGLDQINRNAQSAVAGASGNNAGILGYGALLNSGNMAAQLEQAKSIQRAQEIQSAQNQYGQLVANQGARSAGLYGQALGTGLGYGQLGTEIQTQNQRAQAAAAGTLLSTAGAIGGALIGGPAGAAVGSKAGGAIAPSGGGAPSTYGADYSAAMPGYAASNTNYGSALTAADQPQDAYQGSYSDGLYRGPSVDRGYR